MNKVIVKTEIKILPNEYNVHSHTIDNPDLVKAIHNSERKENVDK